MRARCTPLRSATTEATASAASRGFTLLEVMIAMAILAMSLAALLGHEGVAIQMSNYSNRLTQASLLAQGKFLDIEHKMIKDGMELYDDCVDGDFRSEGYRQFEWKACAYKLELEGNASEALMEQVMGMLSGMGMGELDPNVRAAAAAGDPSGGDMARIAGQIQQAVGAVPMFLEQLQDKIRKVRLQVTWKDHAGDRQVVLERFITALGSDPANAPPPKDGEAEAATEDTDIDAVMDAAGKVLDGKGGLDPAGAK